MASACCIAKILFFLKDMNDIRNVCCDTSKDIGIENLRLSLDISHDKLILIQAI